MLDFVLVFLEYQGLDIVMLVIYKFIKKIAAIVGNAKWSASQKRNALLYQLDTADWDIPKAITFD